MTKLLGLLMSIVIITSFCSCGIVYMNISEEKDAYDDAITALFDALDSKDKDAVRNLFSPNAREQDEDMQDQIDKLLSVYEGPVDEIGWDGLLAGSASYDYGERSKSAWTSFPVRAGDTYYWCYMDLMYENTSDETQIGITQLVFYTADEYCALRYDHDKKRVDSVGLSVCADIVLDEDIRCIFGKPHKYSSETKALNIDDVTDFFESSNSLKAFKAEFGEPNAENIYIFYELPEENGKPHYLKLGIDSDNDTIYGASIVDDFVYVETVYDADK